MQLLQGVFADSQKKISAIKISSYYLYQESMGLIFTAYDEEFCKESFKDTNYGLLQQGVFYEISR